MPLTRRDFAKITAAAAFPLAAQNRRPIAKPNSRYAGVQIGVISYSLREMAATDILPAIAKLGISEVELMSNHAEALVGAPTAPAAPPRAAAPARAAAPPRAAAPTVAYYSGDACAGRVTVQPAASLRLALTPEQEKFRQDTAQWRTSAETMNKYRDLRKQFDDAGVNLGILCYNMNGNIADDEIDYAFRMAQALGVRSISSSSTVTIAKRVAAFADRYKMIWAGHGHDDVCDAEQFAKPETFEKIMSFSPYIAVNLDIGHFTAAGYDAVGFIRRYHDKITNLHLKDRTRNPQGGGRGGNLRWGDGETPIREVLQLLRREQYGFPANIEYEYQGTDPVIEVAKCLQYAKDILLGIA
jgi:sugar phosphate isomerase/epimerase